MMNARTAAKKDLGRSKWELCNKPSPSVFLSIEFVRWHPYKSQVQHFEEFKTLKENFLNNMLDCQSSLRFCEQLLIVKILSAGQ